MTLAICRAAPGDLDAIDRIEAACFSADRFSRRNLARMLSGGRTVFLMALLDGQPAGYLALSLRKTSRIARLYSLAVLESARGHGAARALIEAAMDVAKLRGQRAVRLEVRASNVAARRLYERAQFRLRGRRIAYYDDGEDALLFERATTAADKDIPS